MCSNNPKLRSDGECDWIGEYGTFEAHIKICQNKRLNCSTCSSEDSKVTLTTNKLAKAAPSVAPEVSTLKIEPSIKLEASAECANTTAGPTPDTSSPPGEEHSDSSLDDNSPDRKGKASAPHESSPDKKPPAVSPAPTQQAYQPKPAPKIKEPVAPKTVQPKAVQEEAPKKKQVQEDVPVLVAVHNYNPETDNGMMSVLAGDRMEVFQRHESGWCFCRLLNKPQTPSGWVPNWVLPSEEETSAKALVEEKVVTPEPEPQKIEVVQPQVVQPQVVQPQPKESKNVTTVTTAFNATDSSQLTLAEELVEIVQQHTTGWTYGRKTDGSEGWFPDWACAQ
jgi:hypothetical protein